MERFCFAASRGKDRSGPGGIVLCAILLLLTLSAPPIGATAMRKPIQGTVPTDGTLQSYVDFSIRWPRGYTYTWVGKKEDDRTIYSIGDQSETHWAAMRVDTMPIDGLAGLFSSEKVYSIAQGRVLKQMRKDFPDLQLIPEGKREIGGVEFQGAQLRGNTADGKLPVIVKLFLNKRDSKLYIITAMEVSRKPGARLAKLSNALDTFEFPSPNK